MKKTVFVVAGVALLWAVGTSWGAGTADIQKFGATAGSTAGSDSMGFAGVLSATADDLNGADEIVVTVDSSEMAPWTASFPINGSTFKGGKYTAPKVKAGKTDPSTSFKYDTKNGKVSFAGKNLDLRGLCCPVTVDIEIGSYAGHATLDEDIVNGKKPIDIRFLKGVKNTLRVDKLTIKQGKTAGTDSITVSGAFTIDSPTYDKGLPVTIGVRGSSFEIPGDQFAPQRATESCKTTINGGAVSAKFDFAKCAYTVSIKNMALSKGADGDFEVDLFGASLPSVQIAYSFWELTQYDQPGMEWTYQLDKYGTNVTTVYASWPGYRVTEDEVDAWATFDYHEEPDGTHCTRLVISGESLEGAIEFDFDVVAWPKALSMGQTHRSATSPSTGSMSAYGATIDLEGTAWAEVPSVGPLRTVKAPSGTYETTGFNDSLHLEGVMLYGGGEVGTFKIVLSNTVNSVSGFGVVKRVRKASLKFAIPGAGTMTERIGGTYLLVSP